MESWPSGAFTRTEALAAGVTSRRIDGAVARGELARIVPGLYARAESWTALTAWSRHRALAVTAARTTPDAILSHESAAALLGLPMPPAPPARATMTVLDDVRTSRDDAWRQFRRGTTPPEQIVVRSGIPELVPHRTVLDCARTMRAADALAVIDAALSRGLVTHSALRRMREHQRRWPGIAVADDLLILADDRRESWLESVSAWVFHSWDVPAGVPQVVVRDARGRFVGRVDAAWAGLGVVGEADGRGKYLLARRADEDTEEAVARAMLHQARRESRLRDLGLEVVRWDTDDALVHPLELRTRWWAAVNRARPELVTARFECGCCSLPLTDCPRPTIEVPRRGSRGG